MGVGRGGAVAPLDFDTGNFSADTLAYTAVIETLKDKMSYISITMVHVF